MMPLRLQRSSQRTACGTLATPATSRARSTRSPCATRCLATGRASLQAACPQALLVGSKTADELAVHYASADAFVFASLTETFGNVTPEAMASALPVLAFDYAAAAQLIRSGENGLLAPCGDARAFDELAAQLAADPACAAAMGQAARRTAEQLDWAGVLDKIEALFASVLRGGHGAPAAANASGSVASSIAKA